MVGACGLIDPVSILLHNTEVLHNILYHQALPNAVEMVLDYILRSDLYLVHHLKRQFYWFANVLFLEEIDTENCPTFVCLGDTDQVVPIHEVRQYVENFNNKMFIDVPDAPHKSAAPIDLLWFEQCDHAGYISSIQVLKSRLLWQLPKYVSDPREWKRVDIGLVLNSTISMLTVIP